MSKLLEDVRNISEEFLEYINYPSWNRPLFYFDDDDDEYIVIWRRPKAITPGEPSEEPEDPLIMGEEELSTIPEKDKSSVEDLVPIPSGSNDRFSFRGVHGELVPLPPGMDKDEFDKEEYDCYDDDTSSDDESFENIDYVAASPPNFELVSLEEVGDVEPDQGGLTGIVIFDNSNDHLLELPEFESFHFDPSFPSPLPVPPNVEISLIIKTDAPVINNFDELNEDECFDPGGDEIDVEDDDSFTFVIWTFLLFLTYPVDSPFPYSFGSEDTIFDPDIST
ncbi:hypothetical protein Tco_0174225 [Tanacetum coccineum]